MHFLIDLIVVAIIGICVLTSAKRGFVKVVIEVVGFVLAIILTFTISSPLATATYDKIIEPPILEATSNISADSIEEMKQSTIDALPKFVTENAELLGFSIEEFADKINAESLSSSMANPVQTASQQVIKPAVSKILELLYSIILMIVLMFIVKIVARFVNKIFSFSIIGKANSILGGVVGVPKGIIFAIVFCMIISLVMSFSGEFFIFTYENIEKTMLFKMFSQIITL